MRSEAVRRAKPASPRCRSLGQAARTRDFVQNKRRKPKSCARIHPIFFRTANSAHLRGKVLNFISPAKSARWSKSPPQTLLTGISGSRLLLLHLRPLTSIHDLGWIDRFLIYLLLENLPVLCDQEIHTARRLVFVLVDPIFAGNLAAPVTEQREGNSNLIGEGFVREPAIHAHTQDLGVCSFQ